MDDGGSESEEEGISTTPWRARKTVTRRLRRKQKGTTHRARVSRQTRQPGKPHLGVHPTGVRLHGTRFPGMRPHATRLPNMHHPVTRPRNSRHSGTSRTHVFQLRNLIPRRTGATNLFPAFQFEANCGSTRAPPLAARAAWREGYSNENIQVAREPTPPHQTEHRTGDK